MQWRHLRRNQLDAFDRNTPVLLATAAVEQHGDHLPLGTDCMIVEAVLERLDAAVDHKLLILPTQQVGCSEHHMKLPGSLTLQHDSMQSAVIDVIESVIKHGFKRIAIINAHGGNQYIDGVIGEKIGQRYPDVECLVTNWWTAAREKLRQVHEGGFGSVGHACEFETSLIQVIAPETVDMAAAVDGGIQHRVRSMWFDLFESPVAACYRPFHVLSKSGAYGKPSLASPEKGQKILDLSVEALKELICEFWPEVFE
jgi:creatinine amidohydrolase